MIAERGTASSSSGNANERQFEQMGHASIAITVDVYGHMLPGGNKSAVDRLDVSDGIPGASESIDVMVSREGIEPSTRRLRVTGLPSSRVRLFRSCRNSEEFRSAHVH